MLRHNRVSFTETNSGNTALNVQIHTNLVSPIAFLFTLGRPTQISRLPFLQIDPGLLPVEEAISCLRIVIGPSHASDRRLAPDNKPLLVAQTHRIVPLGLSEQSIGFLVYINF